MADTRKFKKTEIAMLAVIIALAAAFCAALIILLPRDNAPVQNETETGANIIQYDEAAVILDEEEMRSQFDDVQKKTEEGKMSLRYQKTAYSSDGVNFKCEIGNSSANDYDMYINIYKDPELTEQILLTGLIPPGSKITEFESEIPLAPGTYNTTLVLTQVEDDRSTFHAQLMITLDLVVE